MKTGPAIAEILKKEGVEYLFAYPVNHLIEACAAVDIRPIIVRQERIGLHMADAMSRMTKGRKMGVFCMQSGPGSENAYGGVAQAFGESVPLLVIHAFLQTKTTELVDSLEMASVKFLNSITERRPDAPAAA